MEIREGTLTVPVAGVPVVAQAPARARTTSRSSAWWTRARAEIKEMGEWGQYLKLGDWCKAGGWRVEAAERRANLELMARQEKARRSTFLEIGITQYGYEQLLDKQKYKCLICRRDHPTDGNGFFMHRNPETREIEGLICKYCRRFLNMLFWEDMTVEQMAQFVRYARPKADAYCRHSVKLRYARSQSEVLGQMLEALGTLAGGTAGS